MRVFGWRGLSATLAVICVILGTTAYRESVQRSRQSERSAAFYKQAKALEALAATRKHEVDSLNARLASLSPSPIYNLYVDRLRKLGLEHPVEDLVSDLKGHPEIIPYSGISGGRMGFYDTDRIRVLNDSWVYAPFEDGHVGGDAILGYQVAPGGKISWHLVTSRML
jgi:hypothetical protein